MAQIQKPTSLEKIWSESGDRATPPDSKISSGWQVEIPPRQWFNWIDNRQDQAIAHINQHGIPVWDEGTEYHANRSYVQDPINGNIYRSRVSSVGRMPSSNPQYWEAWSGAGGGGEGPIEPGQSYNRTTSRLTTVTTSWVTEEYTYATTSALTTYTTSWVTGDYGYKTTSATTTYTTSWNRVVNAPVYTLSAVSDVTWSTGWQVGDIATVTGATVAPGYQARTLRITSVDAQGRPTTNGMAVVNGGGYINPHFPSGSFSGPRGLTGSWTGGQVVQVGSYSLPASGPVYSLFRVGEPNWSTGWQVGDIATVTGGALAPGYSPRQVKILSLNGQGKPTGDFEVVNEGGYTHNLFRDGGFTGRGSATWTGGVMTQIGSYSLATSATTSHTTSWNTPTGEAPRTTTVTTTRSTTWSTQTGVESKTTSVTTTRPTSWTTIVEDPANVANILVIGQSTIANYGDPSFSYTPSSSVERLALTGMTMEPAVSPASGSPLATGNSGNMDGLIGDKLLDSGYSKVRIFNAAVGGTSITWWPSDAPPGAYPQRADDPFEYTQGRLFERVQYVKSATLAMNVSISHILIHIGETDAEMGTTQQAYVSAFNKLKEDLRNIGFNAPILLGRVSYLYGSTSPTVIAAQNQIIAENSDVFAGPNTDVFGAAYRLSDNLHWNASGLQAVSQEWVDRVNSEMGGV